MNPTSSGTPHSPMRCIVQMLAYPLCCVASRSGQNIVLRIKSTVGGSNVTMAQKNNAASAPCKGQPSQFSLMYCFIMWSKVLSRTVFNNFNDASFANATRICRSSSRPRAAATTCSVYNGCVTTSCTTCAHYCCAIATATPEGCGTVATSGYNTNPRTKTSFALSTGNIGFATSCRAPSATSCFCRCSRR